MLIALDSTAQTCESTGSPDPAYFDTSLGNDNNNYNVKIYFNLVYNDQGTNGYPIERLPVLIDKLESVYSPLGIELSFACDVQILNSDHLAIIAVDDAQGIEPSCAFGDSIVHTDGINIFICSGEVPTTYTGMVNAIPAKYMVLNGSLGDSETQHGKIESSTIIHEFGHALGLLHMYHGYTQRVEYADTLTGVTPYSQSCFDCDLGITRVDSTECAESSTNGLTCGDLILDTRPSHILAERCGREPGPVSDPRVKGGQLLFNINNGPFNPNLENYMSLADNCRSEFSPNQVIVMKNHLESHPILQPFRLPIQEQFCNCFVEDPIRLTESEVWSDVVAEFGLSAASVDDRNIILEQDLIIDIDYGFTGCNIVAEQGVSITIASDKVVTFTDDTSLRACSGLWQGIILGSRAELSLDNAEIIDAAVGVQSSTSITAFANELAISESTIAGGGIGLSFVGNINLTEFDGNFFSDLEVGVDYSDGTGVLLISEGAANVFSNINQGIWLRNASAFIENNVFTNVEIGVTANSTVGTNIADNTFQGGNTAISLEAGIINTIFGNQIGTEYAPVQQGIQLSNVTGSLISFNECHATTVGIQGVLVNAEINNNDINTAGGFNQNSGGIRLTMANNCDIHSNDIYANGGTYGIEMIEGFTNDVRDNHDVKISGSAINRAAAIRLLGGATDVVVKSNWTDSYNTHKGIITQNSGANTFDCNVVEQSTEALHIIANSEQQMVSGNKFYTSTTDLLIESVIGVQDNEANEFHGGDASALGIPPTQLDQTAFNVDPAISFHLPANPIPENDWFRNLPDEPYFCSEISLTHPGLPTFTDAATLCDYYNSIKPLYTTNPRLYFIKVYHLLKYAKVKNSVTLPSCITADPIIGSLCGLLDMVEHTTKITMTTAVDSTNTDRLQKYADLRNDLKEYNESNTRTTRVNLKDDITTAVTSLRPSVLVEIRNDSIRLDSIDQVLSSTACVDSLVQNWATSYRQILKWLQGGKLTLQDSTMLHGIAMQCSDNYGDGIHVARAIMGQYNDIYYDTYDDCNDGASETLPRSVATPNTTENLSVFPNPSNGSFIIDFGHLCSGRAEVYTADGKLLNAVDYHRATTKTIDVEGHKGVVIIRIEREGLAPALKRAIILN